MPMMGDLTALPGADLVAEGVADLTTESLTAAALLVSIGAPRLRRAGIAIAFTFEDPERRLYDLLAADNANAAHGRYNSLVRRLVSFERALECALVDRARIERLMTALGRTADGEVKVYFVGGATAVLEGWWQSTIDVDLAIVPDSDAIMRAIPALKESLNVNVEFASPAQCVPVPAGWEGRSRFIATVEDVSFFHFDLYAQALAKVERGHTRDSADVQAMLDRGLITAPGARAYFAQMEPELFRFPAIDPPTFRRAVEEAFGP